MKISLRNSKRFSKYSSSFDFFFNSTILYDYFYWKKCQEQKKKMEAKLPFELHVQYKGLDQGHMEHTWFR